MYRSVRHAAPPADSGGNNSARRGASRLQYFSRDADAGLTWIKALNLQAAARIERYTARLWRIGLMLVGPPVGGPFPDIADHVVDAVAVRRECRHRRGALKAVQIEILDRENCLARDWPSACRSPRIPGCATGRCNTGTPSACLGHCSWAQSFSSGDAAPNGCANSAAGSGGSKSALFWSDSPTCRWRDAARTKRRSFDQKAEFPACCMTTFLPRSLSQLKDSFPLNVGPDTSLGMTTLGSQVE